MTSGEHTAESTELGRSILGIIDAYRMGPALEARDLYRARGTGVSSVLPARATNST